jgi:hypothetical protein
MTKKLRVLLSAVIILVAIPFFFTVFDREYISFSPEEGQLNAIRLETETEYLQSFTATRRSISQLSLFLRPATSNHSTNSNLGLSVSQNNNVLATQQINLSFIDPDKPTQVHFSPPLVVTPGDPIIFSLTVPASLSGQYRAQLSSPEDKPQSIKTTFTINGQEHDQELAFKVFYRFKPPLSFQLGVFLLLLSTITAANLSSKSLFFFVLYTVSLSVAYLFPLISLGNFSLSILFAFIAAFSGMFIFLRKLNLPILAVLAGSHAFAFTTYFPLHAMASRNKLLLFAFLPLLCLLLCPSLRFLKKHLVLALSTMLAIVLLLIFLPYKPPPVAPTHTASIKDIYLDANQIPLANKFHAAYYALQIPKGDPSYIAQDSGWDHFGSYIGFINFPLAMIGLAAGVKRHWPIALLGIASLFISANPLLTPHLASLMSFPPQYLIIVASFSLSVFAAIGLNSVWQFLRPDKLTNALIFAIVFIALFDLLNVSSKTLQFGLL